MGNIATGFSTAFRDYAVDGVPSSGAHEPDKRDIRALGPVIETAFGNIALGGLATVFYETKAQLDADLAHPADTVALVYNDPEPDNNDLYRKLSATGAGSWEIIPVFSEFFESLAAPYVADAQAAADLVQYFGPALARAGAVYGFTEGPEKQLFVAEGYDIDFVQKYYRKGETVYPFLGAVPGDEQSGSFALEENGLILGDDGAVGMLDNYSYDFTVFGEANLPSAADGVLRNLVGIIGPTVNSRITLYRSVTGILALQLLHPVDGEQIAAGPDNSAGGRVRFSLSVEANRIRASINGGEPLAINSRRPDSLLRVWFGRLSAGFGSPLGGPFLRLGHVPTRVSDGLLRSLSGGPRGDADLTTARVGQMVATHDSDEDAHGLSVLRQRLDIAEARVGTWTVAAADSFSGPDGSALGNSEVGGKAWSGSGVRSGGRLRIPSDGFGGAWLNAGVSDCEVEADLYPANGEAALYCRMNNANTEWILVQRLGTGELRVYIQWQGQTIALAPALIVPLVAGERLKVLCVGPRIFVFLVQNGVEKLWYDLYETRLMTSTFHGARLNAGGSVDNFRVRGREAI